MASDPRTKYYDAIYRHLRKRYGITQEMLSFEVLNIDTSDMLNEGLTVEEAAREIIDIQKQLNPAGAGGE